jgi:opacity protein-like surface antigen
MRCSVWVLAAGLSVASAHAEPPGPPLLPLGTAARVGVGDLYVGVAGAAFLPGSPSFSGTGLLGGLPVTSSGRLKLNAGPAVTVVSSYEFIPHLSIEGQVGYSRTSIDRFQGSFSLPGVGALNGGFPIKGDIQSIAAFTNLVLTPFSDRDKIFPYVGAGIGFTSSWASLDSVSVNGTSLPLGTRSAATSFAFDALIGADYRITEHGNLGLVYQFSRTNASDLGSSKGFAAKTGAFTASIIAALFEYRF